MCIMYVFLVVHLMRVVAMWIEIVKRSHHFGDIFVVVVKGIEVRGD